MQLKISVNSICLSLKLKLKQNYSSIIKIKLIKKVKYYKGGTRAPADMVRQQLLTYTKQKVVP